MDKGGAKRQRTWHADLPQSGVTCLNVGKCWQLSGYVDKNDGSARLATLNNVP